MKATTWNPVIPTPFGTYKSSSSGRVVFTATGDETQAWASRPGHAWPCSKLAGHALRAEEDANGDLADVNFPFGEPDDIDGHELTAWMDTVTAVALRGCW
jgi:hypothetical protein